MISLKLESKGGRTNPKLWASSKRRAIEKLGKFSARAMQLAGKYYRDAGGGYRGKKTAAQKSLTKWTSERWTTADGKKAERTVRGKQVMDRYLPANAWKKLTPAERAATRKKKREATSQWVPNTEKAAKAGKSARQRVAESVNIQEFRRLAGIYG